MADKRIERQDISVKDPFGDIRESAEKTEASIRVLEKSMDLVVKSAKQIQKQGGKTQPVNTKGLKELEALEQKSNQTKKARLAIDRELQKERVRLQEQQKNLNKELRDEIQLENKQMGTLEKVAQRSKKLREEKRSLNLETKQGRQRLREINAELNRNNKIVEANSTELGKQKIGIGKYSKAVQGLRGALVKLGLGFGVFQIFKDSFNTIKDFQQGQADLASVLGVNTTEMEGLTAQAKELGATTTFTATQVAELQKEFAKLGFTQSQIQDVTKDTLLLAEATGTELGRAAEVAGATIRGFGLETTETKRVVDVMAKSFSSSSLDMEKFSTAMASVAPVANNAGYSIEQTTALIGTLTDRGIDASTAGTGLRNMFLASNKEGISLQQALDKIANSSDQTATSFDLFGKRGATLGVILAQNQNATARLTGTLLAQSDAISKDNFFDALAESGLSFDDAMKDIRKSNDKTKKATELFGAELSGLAVKFAKNEVSSKTLTKALQEQRDSAERMAETQRNTLGGSLALLSSAWDGFVLSMDEAGGVGEKIRKVIRALADNFDTVVSVLGTVIRAFIAWKVTLLALKLSDKIRDLKAYNASIKKSGQNAVTATSGVKNFGRALKGIGLTAVITILVELAMAFWDIASGAASARRQTELYEQAAVNANNTLEKLRGVLSDSRQEQINEIRQLRAENKISEKEELLRITAVVNAQKKTIQSKIQEARAIYKTIQAKKEELIVDRDSITNWDRVSDVSGNTEARYQLLDRAIAKLNGKQREQRVVINGLKDDYKGLNQEVFDNNIEITRSENSSKQATKATKQLSLDFEKQIDVLSELGDAYRETAKAQKILDEVRSDAEIIAINEAINEELEIQKKNIEEVGEAGADLSTFLQLLEQRKKLEIETAEATRLARIKEAELESTELLQVYEDTAKAERDKLLAQKGLTTEQKAQIEREYQDELRKIEKLEEEEQKKLAIKIKTIKEETNNEIIAIAKETAEEEKDVRKQTAEDIAKIEEERVKEAEKNRLDALKAEQEIIKGLTDAYAEQADKRIEKIEEEITASQRQSDVLSELAKNGNIEAKESLAEQNRLTQKAEAEKAEAERKKQLVLFASSILQSYLKELEDPNNTSAQAFTKAIATSGAIQGFISGLGSFYEGTENTGTVSNPLDNNGGRLAVLHDNERVMTAEQNAKIGGYSNEFVAKKMQELRTGKLKDSTQLAVGWDNHLLVNQLINVENKLDEVNKTIKNKPEYQLEAGKIMNDYMTFSEKTKRGKNTTTKVFKVKV